jgi:ribonuclease HI
MKQVTIYTDGACSGNPGKGGWAAILIYRGHEKIISGGYPDTTNNRMELFAIINALKQLKEPCAVTLYSDSAYSIDPFLKGWIGVWQSRGWKTMSGEAVKNIDLWNALLLETDKHEVEFVKVKGHSDNEFNNRCDEIARSEIKLLS